MIKSYFSSAFILLCFSLFQAAILSNLTFLPAIPDFSLICILFFSISNGKIIGELTGFTGGLFIDFLSAGPFALNCLLRTIIGYIGGIFNKTINTQGFFVPLLLGCFATVLKTVLLYCIAFFFPLTVVPYNIISWNFLFELAANSLLTPVVFKFIMLFKNSVLVAPEKINQ